MAHRLAVALVPHVHGAEPHGRFTTDVGIVRHRGVRRYGVVLPVTIARDALCEHEPTLGRKPRHDVVEVLDLVLRVDDLAGAADADIADEKPRIFRPLGDRECRQLPPTLDRPRRLVRAEKPAAPLDQERRRLPVQDVQGLIAGTAHDPDPLVPLVGPRGLERERGRREFAPLAVGRTFRVEPRRRVALELFPEIVEVGHRRKLGDHALELSGCVPVEQVRNGDALGRGGSRDQAHADQERQAEQLSNRHTGQAMPVV
jgi:hypothetical protein